MILASRLFDSDRAGLLVAEGVGNMLTKDTFTLPCFSTLVEI